MQFRNLHLNESREALLLFQSSEQYHKDIAIMIYSFLPFLAFYCVFTMFKQDFCRVKDYISESVGMPKCGIGKIKEMEKRGKKNVIGYIDFIVTTAKHNSVMTYTQHNQIYFCLYYYCRFAKPSYTC
ncbi:Hypothetical predicted protein [Octopus vulgaris]|uniref:Uncharacterized protein n=1 Tax=Octopus vulgaris TaxID=6645 RepID=A0AA36EWH0_OCTVU|nr:Hypothetical predicted protein [Octopus vulgaris]